MIVFGEDPQANFASVGFGEYDGASKPFGFWSKVPSSSSSRLGFSTPTSSSALSTYVAPHVQDVTPRYNWVQYGVAGLQSHSSFDDTRYARFDMDRLVQNGGLIRNDADYRSLLNDAQIHCCQSSPVIKFWCGIDGLQTIASIRTETDWCNAAMVQAICKSLGGWYHHLLTSSQNDGTIVVISSGITPGMRFFEQNLAARIYVES